MITRQRTSSAVARSRRGWIRHAWRLWPSLVATGHGPRHAGGSSQGLHVVKARGLRSLRLWQFVSGLMRRAALEPIANGASGDGLLARAVRGFSAAVVAVGEQRFQVGHNVLLRRQLGDALGDFVHCRPISALNSRRASGMELQASVIRCGQTSLEVGGHLGFKCSDFCVGHNDKHDNQLSQPCQVGRFRPEMGHL